MGTRYAEGQYKYMPVATVAPVKSVSQGNINIRLNKSGDLASRL